MEQTSYLKLICTFCRVSVNYPILSVNYPIVTVNYPIVTVNYPIVAVYYPILLVNYLIVSVNYMSKNLPPNESVKYQSPSTHTTHTYTHTYNTATPIQHTYTHTHTHTHPYNTPTRCMAAYRSTPSSLLLAAGSTGSRLGGGCGECLVSSGRGLCPLEEWEGVGEPETTGVRER